MALTPGSVVKISGAPVAGEQLVEELTYTGAQIDEATRLMLSPARLAAHLPEAGAPAVTPIGTADTPTKVIGGAATVLDHAEEFSYNVGGDYFEFSRVGAVDVPFHFTSVESFAQDIGQPDAEITLRLYKNGVALSGIYVKRTIRTANTVGVISLAGHLEMSDGDYLELWVESTRTGDFNSWSFNSDLVESAL
jgi:hypothetical protein